MGWFLDGRVSAVVGSHTHVQTADERVLPGGTAYLTDAGMCGPDDSVIGVRTEQVLAALPHADAGPLRGRDGPGDRAGRARRRRRGDRARDGDPARPGARGA